MLHILALDNAASILIAHSVPLIYSAFHCPFLLKNKQSLWPTVSSLEPSAVAFKTLPNLAIECHYFSIFAFVAILKYAKNVH